MMSERFLSLTLLGSMQIEVNGGPARGIESSRGRGLLAYLVVESDRPHSREALATLFWPEESQATALRNLRQALYNLRRALPGGGKRRLDAVRSEGAHAGGSALGRENGQDSYLQITRQDVQFNRASAYRLDVEIFQNLLAEVDRHPHPRLDTCYQCMTLLQEAVTLYRGEFLTGFSLPDADDFERWLQAQRDQLAHQAVTALDTLATFHEHHRELSEAVAYLHRQLEIAPWREEGYRHLMRVLALRGDRTAALQQYEACRRALWEELAAAPQPQTETLYQEILAGTVQFRGETADNPYKGLHAFTERDSVDYFGRDEALARLLQLVDSQSVVLLNGSSGSGKSSLIHAGLLPRLHGHGTQVAGGTGDGTQRERDRTSWIVIDLRLGSQPVENLAAVLATKLEPTVAPDVLAQELRTGKRTLYDVAQAIIAPNGVTTSTDANTSPAARCRLLLVIDQFEELFSQTEDEPGIAEVLSILVPDSPIRPSSDHPLTLLLSLRAGFGRFTLTRRSLVDAMQDGLLLLGPMNRAELERTIVEPARNQGVLFEPGLTERILDDVGEEPGRLPLLQFALTQLWQRQYNGVLPHAAYDEIGGVSGALASYAEQVFSALSVDERVQARQLVLQLVRPGDATDDTSRRVTRTVVGDENWLLAQKLADARLLVIDQDASGQETVELAHEALIRYWDRLRSWLVDDRVFRLWRHRLETAFEEWRQDGCSDDMLLRGGNLAEAAQWEEQRGGDLPGPLAAFVAASMQAQERRLAAEEARRQDTLAQAQALVEAEHQRAEVEMKASRRLRYYVLGLMAALLAAIVAATLAWDQRGEAQRQAGRALVAEATAEARRVLTESALVAQTDARANAEEQHRLAQDAQVQADASRQRADEARQEAERQARLALGRELSANVVNLKNEQPDLALLLARESWKLLETKSDRNQLLTSISSSPLLAKVLHGEDTPLHGVAFSATDAAQDYLGVIVGAAEDGIRTWNSATGQETGIGVALPGRNPVIAVDPGGRRAVSAKGTEMTLWDAQTGKEVARLRGHADEVEHLTFSVDGSRLASTSKDGTLILWDGFTGQELKRLPGFGSGGLALGPGGNYLAIYGHLQDGTGIEIWDLERGIKVAGPVFGHEATIESIRFSPDGSRLVTASDDQTVRLWDGLTGQPIGEPLRGHNGRVVIAEFSPDGGTVASGGTDNQIFLWDIATGKPLGPALYGHHNWVRSLAFDAKGRRLASGDAAGQVNIWDLGRHQELYGHNGRVREVALSPDGSTLYTASYDKTVKVWDAATADLRTTLATAHPNSITVLATSPDGRTFATADAGGHLTIWDASTLQPLHPMLQNSDAVLVSGTYSPDGRLLALGGFDGAVTVWDVASGRLVASRPQAHDGWVLSLAFSPDGKLLASGASDASIHWWDVSGVGGGTETTLPAAGKASNGHTNWVTSLLFTPDGKTLISGGADPAIRFWDAASHEPVGEPWRDHEQAVWKLMLFQTGNGPVLVSLGGDGTVLWQDLETGVMVAPGLRTGKESEALAIGPKTPWFFLGTADDTAQVWRLPLEDWQEWACDVANRNLTPEEWHQYLHNDVYEKTCPELP